jgi:hypothetical protein
MQELKHKIEIRQDCKQCGKDIVNARYRTFCSKECRNKYYNKKYSARGTEWHRKNRDRIASEPSEDKCQCLICGKWYVQVCSHVYQVHKMTGREYREYFRLEVKKGVVPEWYRKLKGEQAIDNETYKNLEKGAGFRFKKGQEGCGIYERSPITIERLKKQGEKIVALRWKKRGIDSDI